ncbi:MAG: type II toxin-antitoxin system VapC family toxin [Acidobacteria bacterium]|nr:type II toxin-antitoxin system VapC family toxin [Acidobacteriota bacterium]
MLALDTNSLRRALARIQEPDALLAFAALRSGEAVLPPVVVAECFSDPSSRPEFLARIMMTPMLPRHDDYWQRAGELRAFILRQGLKALLPDTLIAQSCIDHDVTLITYDRDFRHFQRAGLKLA